MIPESSKTDDINILRELARRYREVCETPRQAELRKLWKQHNSLIDTRPLVCVDGGRMWREVPGLELRCTDPLWRDLENFMRHELFLASLDDDTVFEPWLTVRAVHMAWRDSGFPDLRAVWGVEQGASGTGHAAQNMYHDVPLKTPEDMAKLRPAGHVIDEEATRERFERVQSALGDILPVALSRRPLYSNFHGDISSDLASLVGLEQMMLLMYENPAWLHQLAAFMRDTILAAHDSAETAGDFQLCDQNGVAVICYANDLPDPAYSGAASRSDLWGFFAAQEFTLVSPEMHQEFMLDYQLPIMCKFGHIAYGCCENLTRKIDMLRRVPNLRRIAVTPVADVGICAEQIGRDYVISWRPNPADMVCCGFDEVKIRRIISDGLVKTKNCIMDINLKDIDTVENEPQRLARWVQIIREEIDAAM